MEIDRLNLLRKKYTICNSICYSIAILLNILFVILCKREIISLSFNCYFVLPFTVIFSLVFASMPGQKYAREYTLLYKNYFVYNALKEIFTDLEYEPEMGISRETLRDTKMIDTSDRYHSNDYIKGKYKDVNFISSDVHIEEEHEREDKDGNKETYYVTLFMGRWFIFDFNKTFKSNLCVSQTTSVIRFYDLNYEKINLEDEEFNKNFLVYAQNEHEAFYILSPSFMERIKDLSLKINGKLILCFNNNKLYLGLNNYLDSFEPSMHKKVNETIIKDTIKKDIDVIINFIEQLDLDNDLFKED